VQEKKLVQRYFDEITHDTGKYCFGVDDTFKALELGAVETLIVWENLELNRLTFKNTTTGEVTIKHLTAAQEKERGNFIDKETKSELEVVDKTSLLEYVSSTLF
jgi:peptide chain release factor subunit 1